ncbi:MAG TPA: hypothetical protein PLC38_08645 [Methanobacterium sp.]|jgi:hypothetical protein|nr:MAG: hypothetical protein FGO69_02360 [Methanobacterium sp.]HOI72333.1 hypothetical protein [Methanobacterium sp.]
MHRNSIPDLRKKPEELNLLNFHKYFDVKSCVFIGLIILVLVFSVIGVAALPNSNFPATI